MSIRTLATGTALALALCTPAFAESANLPQGHSFDLDKVIGKAGSVRHDVPLTIRTASEASAVEGPVEGDLRDAASAAVDSAATTGTCDSYFTKSQGLTDIVSQAFAAMAAKDAATMTLLQPKLDNLFKTLPNSEVAAESCVDHINAYTSYQFFELTTLRNHGIDIGLPAGSPIVKQPMLNHLNLAYANGWIKYEKADYEGALAAYGKGLVLYPHEFSLQSEYLATLLMLDRYAEAQAFAENVLTNTLDLDDTSRAKTYAALATSLIGQGDVADAQSMLIVSLRYGYDEQVALLLEKINALAKP